MADTINNQTVFLTLMRSDSEKSCVRILIDSIRSFGGTLSNCPIWIFEPVSHGINCNYPESTGVRVFSLNVPDKVKHYLFADKVYACAEAEKMATPEIQSLVWIDPACLVIKPPILFNLNQSFDAAVRPVHIRNVGLPSTEPLNDFWNKIFEIVGIPDIQSTVETFVDTQRIRSYFNSHAFSVNPSKGLLRKWFEYFEILACDEGYQANACSDNTHRVFLHQAILSALLISMLTPERVRILPPDYNYPYNLHRSVPPDRRAAALNDLVCIAYEDRSLDPNVIDDIDVLDPLKSWLFVTAKDTSL